MADRIKGRFTVARKTEQEWLDSTVILLPGEIGVATDTQVIKVGNGSQLWRDLKSHQGSKGDKGNSIETVRYDGTDLHVKVEGSAERNLGRVKGEPFTYENFTPSQLAALKGEKGDQGPQGEKGETGKAFTYEDLTPEQRLEIRGAEIDTSGFASKADLDGKANKTHTHAQADITGLQTSLNSKANVSHTHSISNINSLQTTLDKKSDKGHTHPIDEVTGLQSQLDTKGNKDDVDQKINYIKVDSDGHVKYIKSQADFRPDGPWKNVIDSKPVALKDHTHEIGDITGLQSKLDDLSQPNNLDDVTKKKINDSLTTIRVNGNGKPQYSRDNGDTWTHFVGTEDVALKNHGHSISDVSGLQGQLDGKASKADLENIDVDLSDYAKKSELNNKADKTETAQKVNYVKVDSDGHVKYIKDQADFRPDGPWKNVADSKPVALKDHKHGISDINGLQSELDSLSQAGGLDEVTKKKIDDSLTTFRINQNGKPQYSRDNGDTWTHFVGTEDVALKDHTHSISDVTGLQGEINNLREGLRTRAEDIGRLGTQVGRIRDNKSGQWLDVEIVNSGQVPSNTSGKIVFERE